MSVSLYMFISLAFALSVLSVLTKKTSSLDELHALRFSVTALQHWHLVANTFRSDQRKIVRNYIDDDIMQTCVYYIGL